LTIFRIFAFSLLPACGLNTFGQTDSSTKADTSSTSSGNDDPCSELAPLALDILTKNCAKCHGPGSASEGGIAYILDLEKLVDHNKVVPGDATTSRIFARIVAETNPMPPTTETVRPSALEKDTVEAWINQCISGPTCADRAFIGRDEVLVKISQDLNAVDSGGRPFTRYLTFVHLYNAGYCDSQIDAYRQALSKLVNSLSTATKITAPAAIDDDRLIFRIDIRDYRWQHVDGNIVKLSEPSAYFRDGDDATISVDEQNELDKAFNDVWDMMVDQNPYTVEYLGDVATDIKSQTSTQFPIVQGDAFIDIASRSPLYYDILNIPKRSGKLRPGDPDCGALGTPDVCLETQLAINILNNIADELLTDDNDVARAGLKMSAVSEYSRVVERHADLSYGGAFWISYDFDGEIDRQNIMAHPLDFDFDSSQIIFTLRNGLQGYMLTNAAGGRINEAPITITQDASQHDFLVRNGISCIGCHTAGIVQVQDDIRYALDAGTLDVQFDDLTKEAIRSLYPRRDDLAALQQQDIDRFNSSLDRADVARGTKGEPVITSFTAFDENVTLRRMGAEYDLTELEMLKNIGKLSPDLFGLADGRSITRRVLTDYYRTGVCILNLGCTRSCPGAKDGVARICLLTDTNSDGIGDAP